MSMTSHEMRIRNCENWLVRVTEERDRLLAALEVLFADYKQLVDSGDCGFWNFEETPEAQQAIAAMEFVKNKGASDV